MELYYVILYYINYIIKNNNTEAFYRWSQTFGLHCLYIYFYMHIYIFLSSQLMIYKYRWLNYKGESDWINYICHCLHVSHYYILAHFITGNDVKLTIVQQFQVALIIDGIKHLNPRY